MKKSILFGALAFFAVSTLSIQEANAQNEVKTISKKVEAVNEQQNKPSAVKVEQEPVKQCDAKKVSCNKEKAGNCCEGKKVAADKKKTDDCCADKKAMKAGEKKVKSEGKKLQKEAAKPNASKAKKTSVKSARHTN